MSPLLDIEQLMVSYGPIVAVRDVSIAVDEGEIVTLLGANGAGKSSILNAVVGLVTPASGAIRFAGAELTRLPPERIVRHGVAFVPEGRRVFPRMSVADNLRVGAASRGSIDIDPDRRHVLELFPQLRSRLKQPAGTLSGGEQQMLAVGRALMSRPRLILMDEPSLGLAPMVVDEIFELIGQLREEGITILVVEQNVHRALEVADRAYVLRNGEIEQEGPAALLRTESVERSYLAMDEAAAP
jgi:branched-chain amino acid transport system ATP-binding protein